MTDDCQLLPFLSLWFPCGPQWKHCCATSKTVPDANAFINNTANSAICNGVPSPYCSHGYQSRQAPDRASLDSPTLCPGLRLSLSCLTSAPRTLISAQADPALLSSHLPGLSAHTHTYAQGHTYTHLTHSSKNTYSPTLYSTHTQNTHPPIDFSHTHSRTNIDI